jgi:hypothetical protein
MISIECYCLPVVQGTQAVPYIIPVQVPQASGTATVSILRILVYTVHQRLPEPPNYHRTAVLVPCSSMVFVSCAEEFLYQLKNKKLSH